MPICQHGKLKSRCNICGYKPTPEAMSDLVEEIIDAYLGMDECQEDRLTAANEVIALVEPVIRANERKACIEIAKNTAGAKTRIIKALKQ